MDDRVLDLRFRQLEQDMAKRMDLLEQEMRRKGPLAVPAVVASSSSGTEVDSIVIGGFKQDTPKAQALKVHDRALQPKLAKRFDATTWGGLVTVLAQLGTLFALCFACFGSSGGEFSAEQHSTSQGQWRRVQPLDHLA